MRPGTLGFCDALMDSPFAMKLRATHSRSIGVFRSRSDRLISFE